MKIQISLEDKIKTCREIIEWTRKNKMVFEYYAEKQRLNKLLKEKTS